MLLRELWIHYLVFTMTVTTSRVPARPGETTPLEPGARLPQVEIETVEGQAFDLGAAASESPQILIFFRGTWCPQGQSQILELRDFQARIESLGYHMIAICPDRPEVIEEWVTRHRVGFPVLCDRYMSAALAFGIAWRPDSAQLATFRDQGIDIAGASGQNHHLLPVPGIFFVHTGGKIGFVFAHPDHTMRMPAEVLLAIARATTEA